MAKRRVKAPIGYHFMIRESDNDFYLMRTSGTYSKHTAGDYTSSLTLDIEVKGSHSSSTTRQRRSTAVSNTGRRTTTRTVNTTRRATSGGSSSSGGGY